MDSFSIQTVQAISEAVTGGSAYNSTPPVGLYRSGPKLEGFFAGLNIEFVIGSSSRVPAVMELLNWHNKHNPVNIVRVIEAVVDPRDFLDDPDKNLAVVDYLNKRLAYDGYELRKIGGLWKLTALASGSVAVDLLDEAVDATDFEAVRNDFRRALEQAESDPEDAITSACSTVESVCKCILDEMKQPYPRKQDIRGLVSEVAKHLNLSPGRTDLPPHIEADIKQILGGLISVTSGIGALRTHGGDAHGRGKMASSVDARIARLAIHAASTVALFYIETWQKVADK